MGTPDKRWSLSAIRRSDFLSSVRIQWFYQGIFSVLSAIWLWLFFPAFAQIGLIHQPMSFIWFFVGLVLLQFVPVYFARVLFVLIALTIRLIYAFDTVHSLHFSALLDALRAAGLSMRIFFQNVFLHRVAHVTHSIQTEIILLFIALMYWLLVYASSHPKLWTFYGVLSLFIFGLLDGTTNVHPNLAVVVLLIILLLGLCMMHLRILQRKQGQTPLQGRYLILSCAFFFLVSSSVAFLLPKVGAVEPNPFTRHESLSNLTQVRQVHMIGYQLNNARLGGAFIQNDVPVLSVIASHPSYLRGQTLSVYTGKGWVTAPLTGSHMSEMTVGQPWSGLKRYDFQGIPSRTLKQNITVLTNQLDTQVVLGAYAIQTIHALPDLSTSKIAIDTIQGNLLGPGLHRDQTYSLVSRQMISPYSILASETTSFSVTRREYPANVRQFDLQLPSTLPAKVGILAHQVVAGSKTEYQMVYAIENYLQTNYTYQTTNIPVPGLHQDYVAQFLFDSKRGYCNNFSSAMAVMLRTLDIPTRWVTGFTEGSAGADASGGMHRYLITEADAHSWVEVYFPNIGFVPFDPTPNFNMDFAPGLASKTGTVWPNLPHSVSVPPRPPSLPVSHHKLRTSTFPFSGEGRQNLGYLLVLLCSVGFFLMVYFRRPLRVHRYRWMWRAHAQQAYRKPVQYLLRLVYSQQSSSQSRPSLRCLRTFAKQDGITQDESLFFIRTLESLWYGHRPISLEESKILEEIWLKWIQNAEQKRPQALRKSNKK